MKVALDRPGKFSRSEQNFSAVPPKYASARRFFAPRSAVFDPDPSTMLRVMVRYSNHEAQTRRELGRGLASEIILTSQQYDFFNNLLEAELGPFDAIPPQIVVSPEDPA